MGLLVIFVKAPNFAGSSSWTSEGDVPREALRHFNDDPELSLYHADSERDIPRIVAAFALRHPDRIEPKDFIALDESFLDSSLFTVARTPGDVPDKEVREWHFSVTNLDVPAARKLAYVFGKRGRCVHLSLGKIKDLTRMAHDKGYVIAEALSEGVHRDLVKVLVDSAEECKDCTHRRSAHDRTPNRNCTICSLVSTGPCSAAY